MGSVSTLNHLVPGGVKCGTMVCLCQGLQSKTVQEVAAHSNHLQLIKCIFIQKLHKICKLLIPCPILLYLAANSTRRLYRALSTHCLQIKLSQNLKNLVHHSVNRDASLVLYQLNLNMVSWVSFVKGQTVHRSFRIPTRSVIAVATFLAKWSDFDAKPYSGDLLSQDICILTQSDYSSYTDYLDPWMWIIQVWCSPFW